MTAAKRFRRGLRHLFYYAPRAAFRGYRIGHGTWVGRRALIQSGRRGRIEIGKNCEIHDYAVLRAEEGSICIGNHVSVNPFTVLYGHGGLTIGNDVRIAAHCVVVPSNHVFEDRGQLIRKQGLTRRGVVIEDDVWIAAHVSIMDGVRIARGCVIAAGAVVTKSTEPFGVYAGVPAARLRDR